MIEPSHHELSIGRQCELLSLPRASYYRWLGEGQGESAENLALMTLIDEEYTRRPFYGSRKMRDYLRPARPQSEPQACATADAFDGLAVSGADAEHQQAGQRAQSVSVFAEKY